MSAQIHSIDPHRPNVITVLVLEEGNRVRVCVDSAPLCEITVHEITWLPTATIPGLDARMHVMHHAWREYVRRDQYEDFSYMVDILRDILIGR